jgi:hypothetical protein
LIEFGLDRIFFGNFEIKDQDNRLTTVSQYLEEHWRNIPPISRWVMTHKYRGCIVVLSINKSVEPNEEQKVLASGFDQGFTVNTSKWVFRSIW